jgi:hypothetical protein
MGARVIQLAEIRARRAATQPQRPALDGAAELADRFHFWSGASSRRYVHSVYSLVDCPEIPAANFLLVHRDDKGHRSVLAIGHLTHDAGSLNLAELRHRGARLGANEVHVHLLGGSAQQRRLIELDLRAAEIDSRGAERISGTRH